MRQRLAVILALCGLASLAPRAAEPDPEPPGAAKAELGKLKGTWAVTRALAGQRELKAPAGMTYTFDGDKLAAHMPFVGKGTTLKFKSKDAGREAFKVKVDGKKRPFKIMLIPTAGGRTHSGTFKVEKGELFLALARNKGGQVPKDFSGDGALVLVLKKEASGE
jgi:uncharacterized protein (TIGR03067 family)